MIISACEHKVMDLQDPYRYYQLVFDSVTVIKDIKYRIANSFNGKEVELFLDFYEPFGDSLEKRPLIILMHAGGFIQGQRGWMESLAELFPQYGYCCANISYRLYDGSDFPLDRGDFLKSLAMAREDLIESIYFMADNPDMAGTFRIDPDFIYVAGASAGAIAAIHAVPVSLDGSSNPDIRMAADYHGNSFNNYLAGPSIPVKGIISFAGAILDTAWITPAYPEIFCVHGTADNVVPFSAGFVKINGKISPFTAFGSENIIKKAEKSGLSAVLISVEGAGHENFLNNPELWKTRAIDFLYSSITMGQKH